MARPLEGDFPRSELLNCKLTKEENSELGRMAKEAGVSKSKIIQKLLPIAFHYANKARKQAQEKVKQMIKEGNFSMEKLMEANKILEDEMERELNQMLYKNTADQWKENAKKKDSKE